MPKLRSKYTPSFDYRNRCINCYYLVPTQQLRSAWRLTQDATGPIVKILQSWITPTQLAPKSMLCGECYLLLKNSTNALREENKIPVPVLGHRKICYPCGKSILRAKRTYPVRLHHPETYYLEQFVPRHLVSKWEHTCRACARAANRAVQKEQQYESNCSNTDESPQLEVQTPLQDPAPLLVPITLQDPASLLVPITLQDPAPLQVLDPLQVTASLQDPASLQVPRPLQDPAPLQVPRPLKVPHSRQDSTQLQVPCPLQDPAPLQVLHSRQDSSQLQVPRPLQVLDPLQVTDSRQDQDPASLQVPRPLQDLAPLQVPRPLQDPAPLQVLDPLQVRDSRQDLAPLQVPRPLQDPAPLQVPRPLKVPHSRQDSTQLQVPRPLQVLDPLQVTDSRQDPASLQVPRPLQDPAPLQVTDPAPLQVTDPLSRSDSTQLQIPRPLQDPAPLQVPRPLHQQDVDKLESKRYRRVALSDSGCLFPNCHSKDRLLIPRSIRETILLHQNLYIPPGVHVCRYHLKEGQWTRLTSNLQDFTASQFDDMLTTMKRLALCQLDRI